uniref:Uncharacterized protein n=1 Tax=candidate division WOR-3 bacterium TaxID=2052148 RepID=A0A7C4GB26_UNCW3
MRKLIVLVLFAGCTRPSPPPIHFYREEVALDVRPGMLRVQANYHFRSSAAQPVTAMILYPFPLDSNHAWPDSIVIPGYGFRLADSGVTFVMKFSPGSEDSFQACYRQPLRGNSCRYIVTSTRKWKRPIDLARFRVDVPADLPGVRLNYRPDSITRTGSTVTYWFARRRFYPDRDVVVNWSDR